MMNRILLAAAVTTLTLSGPAFAALSGKTADGCSYKVINGQYLTSCAPKAAKEKEIVAAQDPVVLLAANTPPAAGPVTSYDSIPMRNNPEAPQPSVQTVNITTPKQSSLIQEKSLADFETDRKHDRERDRLVDSTYVGGQVGATTIKDATSSTGLGVTLGTSLDDYFGVELGYSYTSQNLNLGLDSRSNLGTTFLGRNDSSLRAHLITGEVQGYLTDTFKRLRPYLGLGLGWKSSTLSENSTTYMSSGSVGSLNQSAFGGIGAAGAKLRVGKDIHLATAFRYFLPFARQNSQLTQSNGNPYVASYTPTRLTKEDDTLTGAAQYQLQGGLEYSF